MPHGLRTPLVLALPVFALGALPAAATAQTLTPGTPLWSPIQNGDAWSLNTGDIGVGTTAPNAKLDVNGSLNAAGYITGGSGMTLTGSNLQTFFTPVSGGPNILVGDGATPGQQSASIGFGGFGILNAGIGWTPDWTTNRLDFAFGSDSNPALNGFAYATPLSLTWDWTNTLVGANTTAPQYTLHVNGTVAGVGPYVNLSDARFKTNVEPVEGALDTILRLRGVRWDWLADEFPAMEFNEGRQVGFIAQEVEAVLPEAVSTAADGTKGVAYTAIVPVLVEALEEQQAQIAALAEELVALRLELEAARATAPADAAPRARAERKSRE